MGVELATQPHAHGLPTEGTPPVVPLAGAVAPGRNAPGRTRNKSVRPVEIGSVTRSGVWGGCAMSKLMAARRANRSARA